MNSKWKILRITQFLKEYLSMRETRKPDYYGVWVNTATQPQIEPYTKAAMQKEMDSWILCKQKNRWKQMGVQEENQG
jgi:hypothetical protein